MRSLQNSSLRISTGKSHLQSFKFLRATFARLAKDISQGEMTKKRMINVVQYVYIKILADLSSQYILG